MHTGHCCAQPQPRPTNFFSRKGAKMSRRLPVSALLFIALIITGTFTPQAYAAENRITAAVNESELVQLTGSTHPMAKAEYDQGAVADSLPMEHMFVILRRSVGQEQALERLIAEMHDPRSANYHKW